MNKERHLQHVEILERTKQDLGRKDHLSQGHGTQAETNAD